MVIVLAIGTIAAVFAINVVNETNQLMKVSEGPYMGLPEINKFCHDKLKNMSGTEPDRQKVNKCVEDAVSNGLNK